jgi:hypothetical protein
MAMASLVDQVKKYVANSSRLGAMNSGGASIPVPAIPVNLDSVESELGFSLPPLLRTLYIEVGNGGFGPGYGLIPIGDLLVTYRTCQGYAEDKDWEWPSHVLPFCYWGCEVYECIDCSNGAGPVVHFDADLGGPGEDNLDVTAPSLEQWLANWLARQSN